jgi:lipoprotein-anchoring transpeptidase ErfK/SrfK
MDTYETRRKARINRARERQLARHRRRDTMASPQAVSSDELRRRSASRAPSTYSFTDFISIWAGRAQMWLRDGMWYAVHHTRVRTGILIAVVALFLLFTGSRVLRGQIFPNVWALGVPLDGLTVEEATRAINTAWRSDVRIALIVEGQVLREVPPSDIGLQIDAAAAAESAKAVGMAGIPLGYQIDVPVTANYINAETYLLDRADEINELPYNAGYEWQNNQVVGVRGRDGRELDIAQTLEMVMDDPQRVINSRRLDLLTIPIPPDVMDPEPQLEAVQSLVNQNFQLIGYDPFTNETITWSTSPEHFIRWIEVGPGQLRVRESAFREFVDALNEAIARNEELRFVAFEDALEQIQAAFRRGQTAAYLRMRYRPQVHTVARGETAYAIARKHGLPMFMVEEMNTTRNLNILSPGDTINIPSLDRVIPETPVPHKRIVVNLETQSLVAFENGTEVFSWPISSGVSRFPTSPGIFQILNHAEVAYGSSFELCGGGDCGTWKMNWFMGIYEVTPGFLNGFHGAVELSNGRYLGDGQVGRPFTYGCVMSVDGNAKMLYDWAETGTMVEIISREFPARSELARQVWQEQMQTAGVPLPGANS